MKSLEMIELKSNIIGDDNREMKKKDNTVLWILGITAVGVIGYLIYRHYNRIEEARLRAESFNNLGKPSMEMELGGDLLAKDAISAEQINQIDPLSSDPSYNVSPEVLIPASNVPQMTNPNSNIGNGNTGGIQIQVQPMNTQQNIGSTQANNVSSVQQNNVNI